MAVRRNPIDDADRRARQQLSRAVTDIRWSRLAGGITQRRVAAALGCSRQLIGAIEAGKLEDLGAIQLARLGAAVGLDVPIRTYAGGSPLRDKGQLRLLARFRAMLGDAWTWRTEVRVNADFGDRRAFDVVLTRAHHRVALEAVTRIVDAQGQTRQLLLKQEAAGMACMVLVLADTRSNRRAVVDGAPTLRPAFPLGQRRLMRDLRFGRPPAANGIVLA